MAVPSRFPVLILSALLVPTLALICQPPQRPLPPDSCLLPPTDATATFAESQRICIRNGYTGLLVVGSQRQFTDLAHYSEVVGKENQFYWLGYSFESGSVLRDAFGAEVFSSSPVLRPMNYGLNLLEAQAGLCLAISGNGSLHRIGCEEKLGFFCQRVIEVPSANVTVQPGRFVSVGTPVTLTCSVSGSNVEISWMASLPAASPPVALSETLSVLTRSSFTSSDAGTYYCVARNERGSFVSDPVVMVVGSPTTSSVPSVNLTFVAHPFLFLGDFFELKCTFSGGAVQWFVNGQPMVGNTTEPGRSILQVPEHMENVTAALRVEDEGFYQCFAISTEGESAGDYMLVEAQPGVSRPVDILIALPNTRNELFVSFKCPDLHNAHDPALVRYCLIFHEGLIFDRDRAMYRMGILPRLLDGTESDRCFVEAVIDGLRPGTPYSVKVAAETTSGNPLPNANLSDQFAVATTYGNVPPPITNLTVTRSEDNKEVQATWEIMETQPPVGFVARYQVQYRDSKGSISTVFRARKFNYLLIQNVINANDYEVRVSSGVVVQRSPILYDYSNFTEWVKVDGIRIITLPPGPTLGLSTTPSQVGTVAAGAVVGGLVAGVILGILMFGLFCLCYKKVDPRRLNSHPTTPLEERSMTANESQKTSEL